MSGRNLTRLGDEGEAAGWWTRIYERNFRGGTELTWRLHFPEISPTRHGDDTEATDLSGGQNHSTKAETTPRRHRDDTEATDLSPGRVEGKKVGRDEGGFALASEAPEGRAPKAPSKRKTFTKPTEAEVRDAFIAKGVHPSLAAAKATEFIGHYESNGWRVGKNPMRSWQGAVQTWFGRLRADGKLEGAARAMPAKPDPKLGRDDVWV
jgi:hypothetical protein